MFQFAMLTVCVIAIVGWIRFWRLQVEFKAFQAEATKRNQKDLDLITKVNHYNKKLLARVAELHIELTDESRTKLAKGVDIALYRDGFPPRNYGFQLKFDPYQYGAALEADSPGDLETLCDHIGMHIAHKVKHVIHKVAVGTMKFPPQHETANRSYAR